MPANNEANLVRVYTRDAGGAVEAETHVVAGGGSFEVIVEGAAGSSKKSEGSPYTLTITALDLTAGQSAAASAPAFNPASLSQSFVTTTQGANNLFPWPGYEQKFTITLTAPQAAAVQNHIFQYTAALIGTNNEVSFVQSPLFILT